MTKWTTRLELRFKECFQRRGSKILFSPVFFASALKPLIHRFRKYYKHPNGTIAKSTKQGKKKKTNEAVKKSVKTSKNLKKIAKREIWSTDEIEVACELFVSCHPENYITCTLCVCLNWRILDSAQKSC